MKKSRVMAALVSSALACAASASAMPEGIPPGLSRDRAEVTQADDLGLTFKDATLGISAVAKNSIASMNGLSKGSLIVKCEGEAVSTWGELRAALEKAPYDTHVTLTLRAGGKDSECEVSLVKSRKLAFTKVLASVQHPIDLGISLVGQGLCVREVLPGSTAALAGMKPGDTIVSAEGVPVQTWNEVTLPGGREPFAHALSLGVRRDGKEIPIALSFKTGPQEALWTIPVLVIRYLPLAPEGESLDSKETEIRMSVKQMQQHCAQCTKETAEALEQGSRFRLYKDKIAPPSLHYVIVDTLDVMEPMPQNPNKKDGGENANAGWQGGKADYIKILERANIRDWVMKWGVKEVWIWGYHTKALSPWESNMAGPYGDISNSDGDPTDLPVLGKTYVVYHYNYGRDADCSIHNHIHQIEFTMRALGGDLWKVWEGAPGDWRCGNCHYPPNGEKDYDYANKRVVMSDIEDWKPEGFGEKKPFNCDKWGGDPTKWYIFWMQSIPGKDNGLSTQYSKLTNWWIYMGDYDLARRLNIGLTEPAH